MGDAKKDGGGPGMCDILQLVVYAEDEIGRK